jgi:DNA-binding transcriptional regulator YdaS (Cro superfamily)
MKTEEAVRLAGTAAELARLLGISRAAVSKWGDEVPPLRAYQIRELIAAGALAAAPGNQGASQPA